MAAFDKPSGRVKLAKALVDNGRFGPATQVLTQHLRTNPNDAVGLYWYATVMYRRGENSGAERAFRRLATMVNDDARPSYGLALVLIREGRFDEARKWLRTALAIDPGLDRARVKLAQLESQDAVYQPPAPSGGKPGVKEELGPGALLLSGLRRLSSLGGWLVLSAAMVAGGMALLVTFRPGRLQFLADRLTFPSPQTLRDDVRRFSGTGGEAFARRELRAAVAKARDLSDQLDVAFQLLAAVVAILGVLLLLYGVLAIARTKYSVYQRRIDFASGVLTRRWYSLWLYEIVNVEFRQPLWHAITRNGDIRIRTDDPKQKRLDIIGFGSLAEQEAFFNELRDAALKERRSMRSWWV